MIITGDCLEQLKTLPDNSIDSLVTDPPAGISFMGKDWDHDKGGRAHWIAWMQQVMQECLRVLKPGAHGLVWALPRTSHWTGTALENAGFEVRDVITHLFGSGFPKSLDISKAIDKAAGAEREVVGINEDYLRRKPNGMKTSGSTAFNYSQTQYETNAEVTAPATDAAKQWQGWGTALKPASEHWILVRKPIGEKTVAANVLKWGTGGINIDGCRIESETIKTLQGGKKINSNNYNNQGGNGETRRTVFENFKGRFPANLVLSHNEDCELVSFLPTSSPKISSGTKRGSGTWKADTGMQKPGQTNTGVRDYGDKNGSEVWQCTEGCAVKDVGGASRFFYVAKASKRERGGGNNHPTVKPLKLLEYLITLITPPSGTVLDPFLGSGSTAVAAKGLGFKFIGIEKSDEYMEIAKKRIENVLL